MMRIFRKLSAHVLVASLLAMALPYHVQVVHATTVTCTPDANPETTSVDGRMIATDPTWSTVRGASAGYNANDSANVFNVGAQEAGQYYIYRSILTCVFSIPGGESVVSASLDLTADGVRSAGGAYDYIVLVSATPASDTAISTDDFDQLGSTAFTNTQALGGWSAGTTKTLTFNATGIASIVNGSNKFGLRSGYDFENVAPGAGVESTMDIRSADHVTSSSRPTFTVNTAAAATPSQDYMFFMYRARPEAFFDFA